MSYSMTICRTKMCPTIENPSPEQIDEAIDSMLVVEDNFVLLSNAGKLVNNCTFVQVKIWTSEDYGIDDDTETILYRLEAQFAPTLLNQKKECVWQYAIDTKDLDFVKRTFRMFALGEPPSVDGWKDITEHVRTWYL